jgi:cell division protein FtsW
MQLSQQLVLAVSILYVLGLVMIFNTSSAEALDLFLQGSTHHALLKQLFYGILGICGAYGLYQLGHKWLIEKSPIILAGATILLVCVFIPGLGISANGARRWVNIFGMSLQPSEFVKYIAPAYFIYRLQKIEGSLQLKAFAAIVAVIAIPIGLILLEPNNGTAAVVCSVIAVVCFLAKVPFRFWAIPFLCFVFIGAIFAMQLPYVSRRIQVYLHPELDLRGKGHQPHQAKIAAGSGGLFGKGPGKSLQKLSYLPEAQNDYIAAIFAEEFGFAGMLLLCLLYGWLGICSFGIALGAKDQESLYLAAVVSFLFTFQAFLNLGVVCSLVPSTGLNLPFFSQGGSSLLANVAGVGLLLSIAKNKSVVTIKREVTCLNTL